MNPKLVIPSLIATLGLAVLGACGGPGPQPTPGVGEPKAGGDAPEGGEPAQAGPTGAYDPAKDPLVNPPSLTEVAPADASQIAEDETLVRNVEGNPSNLNPLFMSSTFEFYFADALFTGLFSFDEKLAWRVNEEFVEKFEESSDHLSYTVTMKPDLTWHDGHPFTAEDVCYSWKQILDDNVPCPAVKPGTEEIADCQVLDPRTVKLVHKSALPTNCWNATFPVIPKHLYEKDKAKNADLKTGDYYEKLNRAPVGNGPWKFVEWITNDKIVLERWDDYKGKKPHFKRMVFRIIPDANTQFLTFNKEEIDEFKMEAKQFATQSLEGSDFAKVGVKFKNPQWAYQYMGWNMDGSNPFFSDLKVRQAMAHACDIPRVNRDLNYNLTVPSYGVFAQDHPSFNPDVKILEFDPDKASRLLDEAGWKQDAARDGWRYKTIDGAPVKFEFTLLVPQGAAILRDTAAIFQEDLKSIGIQMETQILEWATFQERVRKHEFQASIAAWGTGTDPDTMWNLWRSDQYVKDGTTGRNYGGYKNARVDELFELGRKEFDPEKRKGLYREMQKLIYDDQPYLFLWSRPTLWAVNKRLHGIVGSPRGIFNFDPSFMAWWVKAGQQKYPAATPQ